MTQPVQKPRFRLALLPARGGSKRIPRKNLVDFAGKPVIHYPIAAAQRSGLFDTIHVSTDDDEIAAVATSLGADVSFRRPPALADDMTGMLPVARWVVEEFSRRGQPFDDVFILFPCAPFILAEDLVGAWETYLAHDGRRNLISVCRAPCFVEWYYRKDTTGRLVPLHPGGAFIRSQELEPIFFETGTFTIFSAQWLRTHPTLADDMNYVGYELPPHRSIDIDTPADLEHARVLFEAFARSGTLGR